MKTILTAFVFVMTGLFVCSIAMAGVYKGKKVLFIDSYHQGYAWSDGVLEGVESVFKGKDLDLQVVRMDTKRNKSQEFKQSAALKVKSTIENYKPDIVIASDDNASKYVIQPYYRDASLPFVFCGLNWDASVYGLPYSNATGMIEVAPVVELVGQLKSYARGDRIGFLAADVLTMHKEVSHYVKLFGHDFPVKFAKSMQDWKRAYSEMQRQVDLLIVGNSAGIADWNEAAAIDFVRANTTIPTGTVHEHMANFAMLGFAKVAQEQGSYAAETALKILDGTPPAAIPVVKNTQGRLTVNIQVAKAVGAQIPYEILTSANEIIE